MSEVEKKSFPEVTYDAFAPEFVAMRKQASSLTLKFNTTGEISYLEQLFGRKLDDVQINPPILPGVSIGEGSTIGAGSVVTKSIPPRSIAVGNHCRVIKIV